MSVSATALFRFEEPGKGPNGTHFRPDLQGASFVRTALVLRTLSIFFGLIPCFLRSRRSLLLGPEKAALDTRIVASR
jgi:hypothetical protein